MADKRIMLDRAVVKKIEQGATQAGKGFIRVNLSAFHKNSGLDQSGKKTVTEYYNTTYWVRGQNDFMVGNLMKLQPTMIVYGVVLRCEGHATTSDKGYVGNSGTLENIIVPDVPIFDQPYQGGQQAQPTPPPQGYVQAPPPQQYAPQQQNQPYWATTQGTPPAPPPVDLTRQGGAMAYNQAQYQQLAGQQPVQAQQPVGNLYNDIE